MLDVSKDIQSLSHFKRNTAGCLDQMRRSGHPLVLTVNGKAELVVQDAAAYQQLLERVEMVEFLHKSKADIAAGRTRPLRQALEGLGHAE